MPGTTTCTPDNGLDFTDMVGHCFYRANPTNSVREWGAKCDVVAVSPGTLTAAWNPGRGTHGALTVPTTLLSPPPLQNPAVKQYIAMSQIGVPTLWGTSTAAVSLTRYSILGGTQSGYHKGDLVSFVGTSGTFSQEPAIIVDAVSNSGSITQWHFLWGGLYAASNPPSSLAQDCVSGSCRSHTSGTGATMTPDWSGWSLLNGQTISSPGSGYSIGDIVTFNVGAGATRSPRIVVEGTSSGGVTAFDWVDYGSIQTLPSGTGNLTAVPITHGGSGLSITSVSWTQAPFATTIDHTAPNGMNTDIFLTDSAPFPNGTNVQYFYYGDDDFTPIHNALRAKPSSALVIPAGCGTTASLNLQPDASANNANPALAGANLQSSGIYAFAEQASKRSSTHVLSSVLYGGLPNFNAPGFQKTQGGGFRNLLVEGFGIPEGAGYYTLAEGTTAAGGYVGPGAGSGQPVIPTAGTTVEIDSAIEMSIDNVHISDGGIGSGNSVFQCGLDESDPTNFLGSDVGNIVFTDSRLDSIPVLAGPTNPDFALRLGNSCHDSVYRNLTAYDATKADVMEYDGNLFSQMHVGSNAVNHTLAASTLAGGPLPVIPWSGTTFGLAAAADYGLYIISNTSFSQTRCDIANIACVFFSVNALGSLNPGQITDTQVRCGNFGNVPSGYAGVKVAVNTVSTTVSGTVGAAQCAIPPAQLVTLDQGGPIDPSNSLCNNSNAVVAGCTGYQGGFAASQFYTQPAVAYGNVVLSTHVLYAVPFFSPANGGTITKLGLDVINPGTLVPPTQCEVGIYNAFNQAPTTLLVDGGAVPVTAAGSFTSSGTFSLQLAPSTPYFLAVGCNGTVTLLGALAGGGLSNPLVGAPDFTTTSTRLSTTTWPAPLSLPTSFGAVTRIAGSVPNVYAGP